jgi:heat-inducible transcriptional repressor
MFKETITQRARYILKSLVECYIYEGIPVSSRKLVEYSSLDLSPASVRNVMSELEDKGYLQSPHTSAGRIPTPQGYRLFVNSLLTTEPVDDVLLAPMHQALGAQTDPKELMHRTTQLLSSMTKMAAIITVPQQAALILSHIEFLPLSDNRLLVILVLNGQSVQNRIIQFEQPFESVALERAANFLNEHFVGQDLRQARQTLLDIIEQDKQAIDDLIQTVGMILDDTVNNAGQEDYVISGKTQLLEQVNDEEQGVDKLRGLFGAFTEKQVILRLLDKCLDADGMQIFIGEEAGHASLADFSVVSSKYAADNNVVGVLGVIGPSRMPYNRVISIVDATAKLLSESIKL